MLRLYLWLLKMEEPYPTQTGASSAHQTLQVQQEHLLIIRHKPVPELHLAKLNFMAQKPMDFQAQVAQACSHLIKLQSPWVAVVRFHILSCAAMVAGIHLEKP